MRGQRSSHWKLLLDNRFHVMDGMKQTIFEISQLQSPQTPYCSSNTKTLVYTLAILRERHKFRISRHPIRANVVLRKSPFRVYPPGLIKAYLLAPHDLLDLSLSLFINASARISRSDIPRQIKFARSKTAFNIANKRRGKSVVDVIRYWYPIDPAFSCNVKSCIGKLSFWA